MKRRKTLKKDSAQPSRLNIGLLQGRKSPKIREAGKRRNLGGQGVLRRKEWRDRVKRCREKRDWV